MSTLSTPVDAEMLRKIEMLIKKGIASNKADLVRKALDEYIEAQAVATILKASKEPRLEGNLDELAKKL